MAALLTRFAVGFAEERGGAVPLVAVDSIRSPIGDATLNNGGGMSGNDAGVNGDQSADSSTTFTTTSSSDDMNKDYQKMIADMEKHTLYVRTGFAWLLFVVFWMVSWATSRITYTFASFFVSKHVY
jgi:potassium channel subfamily K